MSYAGRICGILFAACAGFRLIACADFRVSEAYRWLLATQGTLQPFLADLWRRMPCVADKRAMNSWAGRASEKRRFAAHSAIPEAHGLVASEQLLSAAAHSAARGPVWSVYA